MSISAHTYRLEGEMKKGNIPVLMVQGKTLPEAWEKSVIATWERGAQIETQYDRPGDPPSRDCTMTLVVENPLAEPRIHRAIPTGLEELEVYRLEVIEGIHDDHVREGGWSYSYHDRLFNYPPGINQIDLMIARLTEAHYTRRAQGITWIPIQDATHHEPPCFQRGWFRALADSDGELRLNANFHWRSRDAYKAAFMNLWAFVDLQRYIAEQLAECLGRTVLCGRVVDVSDSYHIYGKDWEEFKGFLAMAKRRTFLERTWSTLFAKPFFEEARQKLGLSGD